MNEAVEALVARVESLLNAANIARGLSNLGVERSKIKIMAEEAANQWTAGFNPRPVTAADFVALYEGAFKPRGDGDASLVVKRKK